MPLDADGRVWSVSDSGGSLHDGLNGSLGSPQRTKTGSLDIMENIHLNGHHRRILSALFRHPVARNLEWHDVHALLNHIGAVTERPTGDFDVTVGTQHTIIARPHGKDLDVEDVTHVRKFLDRIGLNLAEPAPGAAEASALGLECVQYVAVIDHQAARLFQLDGKGLAEPPKVVQPKDPHGFLRHLEHRKEADYEGERTPEDHDYYERIAVALKSASQIAILTRGTGKSNAGVCFAAFLAKHHAEIAHRIVSTTNADLSHMTDGEIVAKGRASLRPTAETAS
jgi:hypothetical protein